MKIKSVKLKNDYRTEDFVYQKGIPAEIEDNDCYRFRKGTGEYLLFYKSDIENNKTDLFEIEYEQERKYIDVRIEYYDDKILGAFPTRYFEQFSDFMLRNCSRAREIKVTETGKGTL